MRLKPESDAVFADREKAMKRSSIWFMVNATLVLSLLILTSLIGFILALALFLVSFFVAKSSYFMGADFNISLSRLALSALWPDLNRDFPLGLLQHYMVLPWQNIEVKIWAL